MKAIDAWLLTCFGITFLALLEYCIVLALKHNLNRQHQAREGPKKCPKREMRDEVANTLERYSGLFLTASFYGFTAVYFTLLGPVSHVPKETPDSILEMVSTD